jgi:hypothetical protein
MRKQFDEVGTRLRSIILVFMLGIGLSACSGGAASTPVPTAARPSIAAQASSQAAASAPLGATATGATVATGGPCALLTRGEAENVVGQPLPTGSEDKVLGNCTYSSTDFVADADLTVGTWDSMVAAAHGNGANPTSVSGVGDEALNLNGSNGSLLYVRKGDAGILIDLNGPSIDSLADHGLAKEEDLARIILSRM